MKLKTYYNNIHNDKLSLFSHGVIDKTTDSKFIKIGSTLVGALTDATLALDTNVSTILYPTPADMAQRRRMRQAVRVELGRLAAQLNLNFPDNEEALRSSGLTMSATGSAHRRPIELPAPTDVELVDGSQPGYLCIKSKRPKGTIQNLIRASQDPGVPGEQGAHIFVGGGRERELGPFPSGAVVEAVWACLNSSTTEPVYCAPVRRRVQ